MKSPTARSASLPKPRVMTICGTRPDIIKLSRVIAALDRHTDHLLVHTGQNYDYELNEVFFKDLEVRKPDHFLKAAGEGFADTIAQIISRSDALMAAAKPDAVLILGDTNTSLAVIPAKRRHIPVFHMEAGNRCFDQRVPEELNRKVVDHLSDIHIAFSEHARRYLMAEGIRPETIIKTGSPMREVLAHYGPRIAKSKILPRLKLKAGRYFVISSHREENVDSSINLRDLVDSLNALVETFDMPAVFSVHPRTRQRLQAGGAGLRLSPRILALPPLGFLDYVLLQQRAFCVVSDSGTITEESSILNFPAVTIRQAHERPEGMDEAAVVMCGLKKERVLQAVKLVTSQHKPGKRAFRMIPDYTPDNVSSKVVRIIFSYLDYVNRTVWFKV